MTASRDLSALVTILERLRDPVGGCAWDRAQDHRSIAPYAIEEAFEVVDAIERGDYKELCDELGDLLLQVVFHARIAEEDERFSIDDVIAAICGKMIRRHPHVFADPSGNRPDWEDQKARERPENANSGALAGVPLALPAMTRALKLQNKAARVGFDWDDVGAVLAKVREEICEIEAEIAEGAGAERLGDEVGDLLFAVVNLARHLTLDPETVMRGANRKFERRFGFIEEQLASRGKLPRDATLAEMEALWTAAKRSGL